MAKIIYYGVALLQAMTAESSKFFAVKKEEKK
jgi:hypothetical protein